MTCIFKLRGAIQKFMHLVHHFHTNEPNHLKFSQNVCTHVMSLHIQYHIKSTKTFEFMVAMVTAHWVKWTSITYLKDNLPYQQEQVAINANLSILQLQFSVAG